MRAGFPLPCRQWKTHRNLGLSHGFQEDALLDVSPGGCVGIALLAACMCKCLCIRLQPHVGLRLGLGKSVSGNMSVAGGLALGGGVGHSQCVRNSCGLCDVVLRLSSLATNVVRRVRACRQPGYKTNKSLITRLTNLLQHCFIQAAVAVCGDRPCGDGPGHLGAAAGMRAVRCS